MPEALPALHLTRHAIQRGEERLRLKPEEMRTLWLDGTIHIEQAPFELRRADRLRWHNRYRRSQRLLPTAAEIST